MPTRAEILADYEARPRKCRGDYVHSAEVMRAWFDRWYVILEARDLEGAHVLAAQAREAAQEAAGPRYPVRLPPWLEDEPDEESRHMLAHWEKIKRVVFPLMALRRDLIGDPCGYDLTRLFAAVPLNGAEHEAPCPGCGRTVSWRAPWAEDE